MIKMTFLPESLERDLTLMESDLSFKVPVEGGVQSKISFLGAGTKPEARHTAFERAVDANNNNGRDWLLFVA